MAWTLATLLVGCERPRTELVVSVDSEVPWGPGATVQSLVVSVRRGGGDGPLRDRRTIVLGTAAGQRPLPLWVGVLAGDDADTPVWVEALGCPGRDGCAAAQAAVAQRAVARFAAGQTLELPLRWTAACAGTTCASDERCAAARRCEPATRAQADLRTFEGFVNPTDAATASDVSDAASDAAPDVASDVAPDVAPDVGRAMDVGADVGVDVAIDVGRDVAIDVGRDAGADVGTDVGVDVGTDVGTDVGRDTGTDVGTDAGFPPCPVGMRLIPAGMFDMGSTTAADEQPVHGVRLSAFCLDETEVTVSAFGACVTAGVCAAPGTSPMCNWMVPERSEHPINCVAWDEARAYCQWREATLPTEAQWEYAARFTSGRNYPWGNEAPVSQLCWSGGGTSRSGTCPVRSFPLGNTPFGISDMAGNVWEWVADWSGPYVGAIGSYAPDPTGPAGGSARVIRGGAWDRTSAGDVRAANRFLLVPGNRDIHVGIRCARAPM